MSFLNYSDIEVHTGVVTILTPETRRLVIHSEGWRPFSRHPSLLELQSSTTYFPYPMEKEKPSLLEF